jgi:hypothetical protein
MDGSHHDWFEGRRPQCDLMGYIGEATGRVFGRFNELIMPYSIRPLASHLACHLR